MPHYSLELLAQVIRIIRSIRGPFILWSFFLRVYFFRQGDAKHNNVQGESRRQVYLDYAERSRYST